MVTRSFASRFESGSSIRNACGSRMIARPIATRCCWPPESCPGRRSSRSSRPSSFADLGDAARALLLRRLAHAQAVAEVLPHGHVRVERVVLEDHREVAIGGLEPRDVALADQDPAAGHLLETADRAQQRRLPAPGRADEDHELALADREADVVDGATPPGRTPCARSSRTIWPIGGNLTRRGADNAIVATSAAARLGSDGDRRRAGADERGGAGERIVEGVLPRPGHVQRLRAAASGREATLVDFGSGAVLDRLGELGVDRITDVLVTHHHRDQVQGLARAAAAGARIWVPPVERELFATVDEHWQGAPDRQRLRPAPGPLLAARARAGRGHGGRVPDAALRRLRRLHAADAGAHDRLGHLPRRDRRAAARVHRRPALRRRARSGRSPRRSGRTAAIEGAAATVVSCGVLGDRAPDLLLPSHGEPIDDPPAALALARARHAGAASTCGASSRGTSSAWQRRPWDADHAAPAAQPRRASPTPTRCSPSRARRC